MTVHATSEKLALGYTHGKLDAQLIADGKRPRGPNRPTGYPNNMYHRGYQEGLNVPCSPSKLRHS